MNKTTLRPAVAAGAAAIALLAPGLAWAGLVGPAETAGTQSHLAAAVALTAEEDPAARSMFAQAALARQRALPLRGQSDVALWNLVAAVQAQQKSRAFDLVDANVKTVWEIERHHVSAVPLPGAIWLFVMGLLGLAGTRVRRSESARSAHPAGRAAPPLSPVAA